MYSGLGQALSLLSHKVGCRVKCSLCEKCLAGKQFVGKGLSIPYPERIITSKNNKYHGIYYFPSKCTGAVVAMIAEGRHCQCSVIEGNVWFGGRTHEATSVWDSTC